MIKRPLRPLRRVNWLSVENMVRVGVLHRFTNVGLSTSIRGTHTWLHSRKRPTWTGPKGEGSSTINRLSVISFAAGFSLWAWSKPRRIYADSPQKLPEDFTNALTVDNAKKLVRLNSTSKYRSNEPNHDKPGEQPPPSQSPVSESDETSKQQTPWNSFMTSLSDIKWSSLPDKVISGVTVPDWLRLFPVFITKFQNELSMAPGSLAEEVWREANDPEINPEIIWDANVRVSDELCTEEQVFLKNRKQETLKALARYLDIPESDIHPEDVPTIAMCGSGGGLRALVAGASSYISARDAGLFDCITYTAGVSGSCWLQTLYFSSMGHQNHTRIINHLKNRLGVHLAYPPAAFNLINSAPTNKFLLTGVVEKLKGTPDADFGIVDIYGMLLAGRLLVPKGELAVDFEDLKLSHQTRYIDHGQNPLPIYTAVRHEIPVTEDTTAVTPGKNESWFQWFEFTPYEFFCEEVGAGIPIWAMGRQFQNGKTVWRENGLSLAETRIPLLLGIWGSAFCATLSHYYREIRPVMKGLAGFAGIDQMIEERDNDLIKVHPIDPAAIPNFALGMKSLLPTTCPKSLLETEYLQLMDAGMSNNLPIYPLLRPGRNVDVIIAFDASADVKEDNWLKVVDGYAKQRNITGWPVGAGWPSNDESKIEIEKDLDNALSDSQHDAEEKLEKSKKDITIPKDLGHCNVWVGNTSQRTADKEPPTSKLIDKDWETIEDPDAGITVIYFPLLANKNAPGVDPKTSDYLSTWNFVYAPDQIDSVVSLAKANFKEGEEQTKKTIQAVYDRKKKSRLEREKRDKEDKRARKLRSGVIIGRKLGEGDHGNHFS